MIWWRLLPLILSAAGLAAGGCIELLDALRGEVRDVTDGQPPPDGADDAPDDGAGNGSDLALGLLVSNPSPRVSENLSEAVFLTCQVTDGNLGGATLEFRGPVDRLVVGQSASTTSTLTGSMVVDGSNIGEALVFSCVAADSSGILSESNEVLIIPTR